MDILKAPPPRPPIVVSTTAEDLIKPLSNTVKGLCIWFIYIFFFFCFSHFCYFSSHLYIEYSSVRFIKDKNV